MIDPLSLGSGRFQPFTYDEIPFPDYTLLVRYDGHAKS